MRGQVHGAQVVFGSAKTPNFWSSDKEYTQLLVPWLPRSLLLPHNHRRASIRRPISIAPADPLHSTVCNNSVASTASTCSIRYTEIDLISCAGTAPVRSFAAVKTATPTSTAGASAPTQNAKHASDSQMNGSMAQGTQAQNNGNMSNGSASHADHGRKPSVVINASGASGYTPNGGPVSANGQRPPIVFGSQNPDAPSNAPFQSQNSSLPPPTSNPRATSPAHSPQPIPQPAPSGGRPPSGLQNQINGLAFGSTGADTDMMRGGSMVSLPMHERRASNQSMQSEMSNQGRHPPFTPQGSGRGRGFTPNQQQYMGSPSNTYRQMSGPQGRGGMPFQSQQRPPNSPFTPHARPSPGPMPATPSMPSGQMQHQQLPQYPGYGPPPQGYPPQMYPGYDPNAGYYQAYYGYPQPGPSPGPQYGGGFRPPQQHMQPPFNPGTPGVGMARTSSHGSERPPSSIGHGPHTPGPLAQGPTQPPQPQQSSSNFVKPKKSSAIKITDANGNALTFNKPTVASPAPPQGPVIVSTPNASTPPPRAPSTQHVRTESKSTKSSEETKNAFAEQVKRQLEEDKRKEHEKSAAAAKPAEKAVTEPAELEQAAGAVEAPMMEAEAESETAAAKSAGDQDREMAVKINTEASGTAEDEAARKKKEEEDEFERQIAEMEALEREEEEREKAYQAKRSKEKAEAAAREAEQAAKGPSDEELKRQEREAEEREIARERERSGEKGTDEADDESKALFASLKRPLLGPGATADEDGGETPASEASSVEPADAVSTPPTQGRATGTQKPKPAHLKLETNKPVERAEPTPGMQALRSARFLSLQEEPEYPSGFTSPNPALNQSGPRKGRAYDKDFLLQFQNIFKEKPSIEWDQKVRETLGPGDDRPSSARTPSSARQPSGRGQPAMGNFAGPMGGFGSRPPVGSGSSSEQRFAMSNMAPPVGRPGQMIRGPSNLGPGNMSRTNSLQMPMGNMTQSPRQLSQRGGGRGGSKRDDRQRSKREDVESAAKMPLTAGMNIAPLEKSTTGWKASSLTGAPPPPGPDPSGSNLMTPDIVQRKVKAALNKMTPEKFDRISQQILEIAGQSKYESDGRTLRQVIQLTFEKACDEAHWAGMYARFCNKMLSNMSPEIRDDTIKDKQGNPVIGGGLFRKYLLNRCQEEFERGWQANLPEKPDGDTQEAALLSDEYYIAAAAKRRGLGLIQFIGQLYILRMLTLRIMHECVLRLLNFEGDPDEAAVENLTTLLKAIGGPMEEEENGRPCIEMYFDRINTVLENSKLASRPRFMLMDLIDLRKNNWKSKNDSKGPKTIQEIHAEAEAAKAKEEAERQRSNQRGPGGRPQQGRGDARFSGAMPAPVDYNRTNVNIDDLKKLQSRTGSNRASGGSFGPGGGLGPSSLGARGGSRRGASNLGPGSGNSTRTSTPPVDSKKDEPVTPSTAQNAFSALASLDASGEGSEETEATSSPPAASKSSPLAAGENES